MNKNGRKSKTQDQYLKEINAIHGNTYDYSLVSYTHYRKNIKIICKIHGVFEQRPDVHLGGAGCRYCNLRKHLDVRYKDKAAEFIKKSKKIHNNIYDYSKVNYTAHNKRVIIICKEHGEFLQTPSYHMDGRGCKKCTAELNRIEKSFTTEELVKRFKEIHGDTYDYSKVKYVNYLQDVTIICKKHGEFLQKPCNHIQGRDCKKCGNEIAGTKRAITTEAALLRIKEIYGDTYIYDKFVYNGYKGSYTLTCKEHGDFKVIGNNTAFYGIVCPKCKRSFGECQIGNWLDCNNINYIEQFSHNSCKFKHKLRFDFMLPDFKIIIEHDGPQHFNPITYFHGKEAYDELVVKDQIKNQWAKDNGYKLLRISYTNKKYITKILNNYIEKQTVHNGGEAQ